MSQKLTVTKTKLYSPSCNACASVSRSGWSWFECSPTHLAAACFDHEVGEPHISMLQAHGMQGSEHFQRSCQATGRSQVAVTGGCEPCRGGAQYTLAHSLCSRHTSEDSSCLPFTWLVTRAKRCPLQGPKNRSEGLMTPYRKRSSMCGSILWHKGP